MNDKYFVSRFLKPVICISIRESFPMQIEKGKNYLIDPSTIFSDSDGDWYVAVYDNYRNRIGDLALKHFRDI